ncbi:hypothetical protein [Paenibacillus luteus]|uniref:hypothetical protein n=1 Tax=Paenibacillus luteus TaxID=2545753 RepID=UPI001141EA2F|nr:hypothetical protein [Paenibacillus luteus]
MERGRSSGVITNRRFVLLLVYGGITGLLSGSGLGLVMKLLEKITGTHVYILLLNVDFVSWLPNPMPELAEFALHLSVAMPVGILFLGLMRFWNSPIALGLGFGTAIACCTWVPLTQLSSRTPDTWDAEALLWWVTGHLVYGMLLACFGTIWLKRGWNTR